ncbi:coiled-coil domain-containing protein [Adlercreutzia murintestinalis]|uniref:coiled-coil domain-containing protein n=1 Tax=Adlercreutzia murintestinalis TaxID=2941325 RepID=UPI00203D79F8|nr:hypothetical protein [Adlercreutzia murintestinalis]
MSIVLAFSLSVFAVIPSYAETENEAVLNEAQQRLDQISTEYEALSAEINEMQTQIDELAVQVLDAQQAMMEGRAALGSTVLYEYRGGSISTILGVLMGSTDIAELTRNVGYVNQIMDHQAEEINTQKELKEQFTKVSDQLTAQKDEQDEKLEELATKREEATAVVEEASVKVEADNARIEQMRKQADQFIWGGVKEEPQPEPEQKPASSSSSSSNNGGGGGGSSAAPGDLSGFRSVVASAYGGSSDPSTGAVATTATGAICNDSSMGVAIPLSWSNRASYYGKTVEIVYNGRLVYATINDCGNMDKYGCELDLQPGVWKALDPSCTTCNQWGHRNVKYRVL